MELNLLVLAENPERLNSYSKEKDEILLVKKSEKREPTKQFVIGMSAFKYASGLIEEAMKEKPYERVTAQWQARWKASFLAKAGCSIDLFLGIPETAFPPNHPFRKTGEELRLLKAYSQSLLPLALRESFHTPEGMNQRGHWLTIGCSTSLHQEMNLMVLDQVEDRTIEEYLLRQMPLRRVAYDYQGNLYLSVECLRGILTGSYRPSTKGQSGEEEEHDRHLTEQMKKVGIYPMA